MFTREELEDMWENKPHGYFANQCKRIKGKRKYTLDVVALKTEITEIGKVKLDVWAKDYTAAHSEALAVGTQQLQKQLGVDRWSTSVQYRVRAE